MKTDYSTLLITVCIETSIQKKRRLQWTMWYFFSVMETEPTSVNNVVLFSVVETEPASVNNVVLFFSYWDTLINPFNYCSSLVYFYTIYSMDLLSLCSAADKDKWDRRKYGIPLYLTLKIFTRYWYQSFWYQYRSFVCTGICSGVLYLYWTIPYRYQILVGTGIFQVKYIDIRSYDIDIVAYFIDIGVFKVFFGPYNPTLSIALALLSERDSYYEVGVVLRHWSTGAYDRCCCFTKHLDVMVFWPSSMYVLCI